MLLESKGSRQGEARESQTEERIHDETSDASHIDDLLREQAKSKGKEQALAEVHEPRSLEEDDQPGERDVMRQLPESMRKEAEGRVATSKDRRIERLKTLEKRFGMTVLGDELKLSGPTRRRNGE